VIEILARLEAQQREAKAILPTGLAVASAAIAGELSEDGNDLIREIDRQIADQVSHVYLNRRARPAGVLGRDGGLPLGKRKHEPSALDLSDCRRIDRVAHG